MGDGKVKKVSRKGWREMVERKGKVGKG
jgi:hypothetical protein